MEKRNIYINWKAKSSYGVFYRSPMDREFEFSNHLFDFE